MEYCIGHDAVIKTIEKFTYPFMISSLSLAGANAAISDEQTLRKFGQQNREGLNLLWETPESF
jgi:histidinol-phosphate/aromatic aminotransferase/cobyric acid decarboxylase-like protein